MRARFSVFAAVLVLGAACSDQPLVPDAGTASRQIVAPNGTLDENIYTLFQLYPKGLSTAGLNRWNTVKRLYQGGKLDQAKDQVVQLASWVKDQAPRMSEPSGGEARSAAAARLTLYMSLYVYDGPATTPPAYSTGADNAVGIITPTGGGTVVTPSTNAGVSVPVGAVNENTIVVITENPTSYPSNCAGPLPTKLCQYPRFYHFSQFPHQKLNVAAKFSVCHVNAGPNRVPLEDHDGFRLAHNLPANPADYTPGSTIRNTGGEAIEVLPLISQTFAFCDDVEYALNEPTGLDAVLARATSAIAKFITPKSAYAIDQGGGGESFAFSDFNNVDPAGEPNDSVGPLFPSITTSGDLSVAFVVKNVGTATSPVELLSFTLTPVATTSAPTPIPWTAAGILSLVPGDSTIAMTITAPVSSFPSGTYTLTGTLGSDPSFPDSDLGNNVRTATVTLGPIILRKGKPIGR